MEMYAYFPRGKSFGDIRQSTPEKTAERMLKLLDTTFHQSIYEQDDNEYVKMQWYANGNISMDSIPLRLREIIERYNTYDEPKRIVVWAENIYGDLHIYNDLAPEDGPKSEYMHISQEEKLSILQAMIPSEPYNNNGWTLDGDNVFFPVEEEEMIKEPDY